MISDLRSSDVVQLRQLISSPPIASNPVSKFSVAQDAASGAVNVSFTITDSTGVSSIVLLRASVMDSSVATVLQTWFPAQEMAYAFPDSVGVGSLPTAYYWIRLEAVGASGTPSLIGPQILNLNPDLSQPAPPTTLSVSHDAAVNGNVSCYAVVGGVDAGDTIRILVSGYQGNASAVAVAQAATSPVTFTLIATGETVTVTAEAVSLAGEASSANGSVPLVLTSARTAPAAPPTPTVVQFAGGNQVSWRSSPESWVVSYLVYRGQRGDTFITATMLATVMATSEGTVNFTDPNGLTGDYAYYIIAHATATADSQPSGGGYAAVSYSSASIPPNVASNVSNNATVDSIPSGAAALARIYGPGGVGTSYLHYTGFGSLTRPNGTISGLTYTTKYAVVYDTQSKAHYAYLQTNYPSTLPDRYEFVGYFTTSSNGTATGSGATATAVIDSGGHVIQVNPIAAGSGYAAVDVAISGGGGSGAMATGNVDGSGTVSSYTVTNGGSGYVTAPTVTISPTASSGSSGGGGSTTDYGGGSRYVSDGDYYIQ